MVNQKNVGWGRRIATSVATLLLLLVTGIAVIMIWNDYVTAPWTRDGRIRVQVASIAPQVSGQIVELRVADNQLVRKGDVLYAIDPFDYKIAYDSAQAQVQMKAADLQVKRVQAERRQTLTDLSASVEEKQQYAGTATQAEAAYKSAQVQVSQADINLKRTEVRSTVNGYVTNLLLRVGDYATTGTVNISVIDVESYWIDGYFEETKMAHVCVGDPVQATLMGYANPIEGRVQSVTRGISVSDAASSTQGLPSVDPVYTWVRLAQRVPVRIEIVDLPKGVPLVAGMTATISVGKPGIADDDGYGARWNAAWAGFQGVFRRPAVSSGCDTSKIDDAGEISTLPQSKALAPVPANEVNPGLTPAMNEPPRPK